MAKKIFPTLLVLAFANAYAASKTIFQYPEKIWSPPLQALQSKFGLPSFSNTSPLAKISAVQADTFNFVAKGKWERLYNTWGPDWVVEAIHAENDTVVAAGTFASSDRESTRGIALWDGTKWTKLGNGLSGWVSSILRRGSEVFVSGEFNPISPFIRGLTPYSMAKWDGREWTPFKESIKNDWPMKFLNWRNELYTIDQVGKVNRLTADSSQKISGVVGSVNGICALDGGIYLAGYLSLGEDTTHYNIVVWDGKSWSPILANFPFYVLSVDAFGKDLFLTCGGPDLTTGPRSVWKFNLKDPPVKIAGGVSTFDYFLVASDPLGLRLLQFNYMGIGNSTDILRLSRWDGQGFVLVHEEPRFSGYLTSFSVDGEDAYIGGVIFGVADQPASNVVKWDGRGLVSLTERPEVGPSGYVGVLKSDGKNLYFGVSGPKFFAGKKANGIASWNGSEWSTLNGGLQSYPLSQVKPSGPEVNDIAVNGTDVYMAGRFKSGGGKELNNIARWDGIDWQPLGKGLRGSADKILVHGANVYVTGKIDTLETEAGPVYNSQLVQWDGQSWISLSRSIDKPITAMAVYHDILFVSRRVGEDYYDDVQLGARGQWMSMPGFESYLRSKNYNLSINSMVVFRDKLYFFGRGGNRGGGGVLSWDGNEFKTYPSPNIMTALAADKEHFYGLDSIGDVLWRCDGNKFEKIDGARIYASSSAIESHQGFLYTACFGRLQNDVSMLPLARWKDSDFSGISGNKITSRSKTKTLGAFHAKDQDLSRMLSTLGLEDVEAYTPLGQKVLSIGKDGTLKSGGGTDGFLFMQGKEK
jgi:hypothetical protein